MFAAESGTYTRKLLEGVWPSIPTSTGNPGGFLGNATSAESAESAGIFAIFGEIIRGFGAFLRPILPVFIVFPLRVRGLLRKEFPCVFGWERYLFPATHRGRVSIYANIDEAAGRISAKCGKFRKRRDLRDFGGNT